MGAVARRPAARATTPKARDNSDASFLIVISAPAVWRGSRRRTPNPIPGRTRIRSSGRTPRGTEELLQREPRLEAILELSNGHRAHVRPLLKRSVPNIGRQRPDCKKLANGRQAGRRGRPPGRRDATDKNAQ